MIGLGIMGSAMASNLLRAGFCVIGYDVLPAARRAFARTGGVATRSGTEVARRAPIVLTSLPSVSALEAVTGEFVRAPHKGLIVIETSTLPLDAKEAARSALAHKGITLLDCPLSGTGAQARTKDLNVYASGPRAACNACKDVFAGFSRAHYYLGAFGTGIKMKFIANLLVAIHNVAAAEALVLAKKAGLDPELTLKVVSDGAGGSRMLQVRGPMIVANDYRDATMKVEVWQKDMHLIADFATRLECPTPLFATCAPLYTAAMAAGYAKQDSGSVGAVLGAMAGLARPSRKHRADQR